MSGSRPARALGEKVELRRLGEAGHWDDWQNRGWSTRGSTVNMPHGVSEVCNYSTRTGPGKAETIAGYMTLEVSI